MAADDPSFRTWLPRQPVEAKRLQNMQERSITEVRVGPGLTVARKGNSVAIGLVNRPSPNPRELFRMKVTNAAAATDVALAKRWDGTDVSGEDVAVRTTSTHSNGDEIYVFQPIGGTDKTYAGDPVTWRESGGGGGGAVDVYNAGTEVASDVSYINIPSAGGSINVLSFDGGTVSGVPGGVDLKLVNGTAAGQVIQWDGSAWVKDYVKAH